MITGYPTPASIEDYMKESFFLPAEILQAANYFGWMIPKIQVIPANEFIASVEDLYKIPEFRGLKWDPAKEIILTNADRVGVAIRRHEQQQKLYVICKIWYSGKNKEKNHGG